MIKILVVVPYKELNEQVRQYFDTIDTGGFVVEIAHFIGTDDRVIKQRDADIVVARGMTGKALARANPTSHFIEISISESDLIAALLKCRESNGEKGVGVVLTDTGICNPGQLQDLMGLPIYLRRAEDEAELYNAISELYDLGVRRFIGGLTLCRRCEDLSLEYIHIKSGKDAIARALNEAVAAARSLNRERTRANLVATVLNNAEDVMFAVNREGLVIAANTQAAALFLHDRTKSLEGTHIADIFPDAEKEMAFTAQTGTEALKTIGDQLNLVKSVPITTGEEKLGVLITCRNVEALRETEQKIRKALSKKGLVAHYNFGDILCESAILKKLIANAYKYSQVDSNVFIIGETGTGKELFAQSIHNASKRCSQPFVAVNCAALPEQLLESELFGYVEGSFSGAVKGGRVGLFELAHKGTIFLDEIGEMPLSLQAKILRVLEEREIRKIGGDAVVPVDVRIISAMNSNILDRVRNGSFREDLFYRINLLNITIPPLRNRPEDIDLIFRHFVRRFALKAGRLVPRIEPNVAEVLCGYPWRGNVRELRNFCERLVILNEATVIDRATVEAFLALSDNGVSPPTQTQSVKSPARRFRTRAGDSLAERLAASGMDNGKFAASIGISRTTLWRKLKEEEQDR